MATFEELKKKIPGNKYLGINVKGRYAKTQQEFVDHYKKDTTLDLTEAEWAELYDYIKQNAADKAANPTATFKAPKEPKAVKAPKEPKAAKTPKEPKAAGERSAFQKVEHVPVTDAMEAIKVNEELSVSERIRQLYGLGMPKTQIRDFLVLVYQFVQQVCKKVDNGKTPAYSAISPDASAHDEPESEDKTSETDEEEKEPGFEEEKEPAIEA